MKKLLLLPIACLTSCASINERMDESGATVSPFFASVNAVGMELHAGVHRIGVALTYRSIDDPTTPTEDRIEVEVPYRYPINQK